MSSSTDDNEQGLDKNSPCSNTAGVVSSNYVQEPEEDKTSKGMTNVYGEVKSTQAIESEDPDISVNMPCAVDKKITEIRSKCSNAQSAPLNSAPNVVVEGKCQGCDSTIDLKTHGVQCSKCALWFHAVGCVEDKFWVASDTSFSKHLQPALLKSGAFANRFGYWDFTCDHCKTVKETREIASTTQRIEMLERQITDMSAMFKLELTQLKEMMAVDSNSSVPTSPTPLPAPTSESTPANCWNDKLRVDNLFHVVSIDKDNQGKAVDDVKLEEI